MERLPAFIDELARHDATQAASESVGDPDCTRPAAASGTPRPRRVAEAAGPRIERAPAPLAVLVGGRPPQFDAVPPASTLAVDRYG